MTGYSSMPHGYAGNQFWGDPRMSIGFRQGEMMSPYSNVTGRRVTGYQQGLFGALQQQQFANRGMYGPVMGPGYNQASFLTRLAFAGGMGNR